MNRSLLAIPAAILAYATVACSEPQTTPPPAPASTAPTPPAPTSEEKEKSKAEKVAEDAKEKAKELGHKTSREYKRIEGQVKDAVRSNPPTKPTTTASPAPAAASTSAAAPVPTAVEPASASTTATPAVASAVAPPPEEPLKNQFVSKQEKNFKVVELDFAKQKAMNRVSEELLSDTNDLYDSAVIQLLDVVGVVSDPQSEENYYFDNEDVQDGRFEVALVRQSYVKSKMDDVCEINTRVTMQTSIEGELTPATATTETPAPAAESTSAEQAPSAGSEKYTRIKCYNDKKVPTFYQQIVR